MKYLLTSSGITNGSIADALVGLLGKPVAESSALFVPTGVQPFAGGAGMAWNAIAGERSSAWNVGWKSVGLLDPAALPTIRPENWVPEVREADALIVWGGNVLYLHHWLRESGLARLLPTLTDTVYFGVSAGAIVVTPYNCDAEFNRRFAPEGGDMARDAERALGLVDFTLYPHLDRPEMPDASKAEIAKWAAGIPVPVYAIDDDTAITVVDGEAEVVSEGDWELFNP